MTTKKRKKMPKEKKKWVMERRGMNRRAWKLCMTTSAVAAKLLIRRKFFKKDIKRRGREQRKERWEMEEEGERSENGCCSPKSTSVSRGLMDTGAALYLQSKSFSLAWLMVSQSSSFTGTRRPSSDSTVALMARTSTFWRINFCSLHVEGDTYT